MENAGILLFPSVTKCYGNQRAPLSPLLSWKSLSHSPLEPVPVWCCVWKEGWDGWRGGGAEVEDGLALRVQQGQLFQW